ncbi:NAD(P)H-binding protein [Rossellomorea aquimaris]|uniref:Nucleoside-diphosphate-sugar epimerase n=1 Tax=Rossellomorea aquimaris TaxID=189382 RepID=A0A366EKP6_9BACI|nr:NAD(P)H-binding protein [Rossellomorea aquimaris]RBP02987.1 nucleoside-diphosphate-sugar epimerase [Rossellomorea aquimaris]
MEKAMVVGASGGMGYALVMELVSRGIEVVAFARGKEKLDGLFGDKELVKIHTGDAENKDQLIHAAKGSEIIFHALNIPYEEWKHKLSTITGNIILAAEQNNARLAVVDNIYAYGKSGGTFLTEDREKHPHTRKGKLRLEMDRMIKQSSVPALICHFPDFYGPNATNTYIHFTLEQLLKKKKAGFVGPKNVVREFMYTRDGAKAMVDLASLDEAYGQNWNIPAVAPITGNEVEQILKRQLGEEKGLYSISKTMFAVFSLFAGKGMREALEMQYINSEPTILSGEKVDGLLGKRQHTSYEQGIAETVAFLRG